ncbi:MAG: transketolase C-terminal domain-containing protein [Christensenella sp.]|nr:transketolase C-terminal domain-containing protein [Christensenella sp.]
MVKLRKEMTVSSEEMRFAYCNALIAAAEKNPKIVSLDCDLSSSCGTKAFKKTFPQRAFNLGIQEQNACAMAGGLSATGLIPFFHTFAVFATRRVYDQIFLSCAYAGQNVKIVGCDAGVSAAFNGGTHMAFEDVGIMRVMPHVTIVEPSDPVMMRALVPQIAETYGVFYLRMPRKTVYQIYEEGSAFTIGKAEIIREGSDVTLIATGMEVIQALRAADQLAQEGISARVVDMFTIKPIDADCIKRCAAQTGAIVTCENENIIGGLGSAVAEVLVESKPVPMGRVGVADEFGEVGPQSYLEERFKLTAPFIVEKAKEVIARKA